MKILIISASYGTGHNSVARAAAEELSRRGAESRTIQIYGYSPKKVEYKSREYLRVVKYFPHVYHRVWCMGADRVRTRMSRFFYRSLKRPAAYILSELRAYAPDAVLCTHIYCGAAVTRLKEEGLLPEGVRTYSFVTDYCLYPNWESNNGLDGLLLPHESLIPELLKRGYRSEQLLVTGFPTAARFNEALPPAEARDRIGAPRDAFTVLLLSGGNCVSSNLKAIEALCRAELFPTVLSVCGNNRRERERIDAYVREHGLKNVLNFGFVDNVDVLVSAADVVFSRGGGGTLSELLNKGAAIVLREKLITQEKRNGEILKKRGAAEVLDRIGDLPRVVSELRDSPARLEALRSAARAFARPRATEEICSILLGEKR